MDNTNIHLSLKRNLCLIYCGIIWLIYTPICLYGVIKLYKHRQNIVISKRHSVITLCLLICMLLLLSIFLPLLIITFSNSNNFINIESLKWDKYGIYTFYPMIILLFQVIYIFIWRQYLYYNDISLIKFTSDQEWTDLLNPPKNQQFTNKLISSISFYKIMLLLFCFTSITLIFWSFISSQTNTLLVHIGSFITAFFWCILCLTLIILRCITPKFEDGFFIRKEMIYWIYIIIIGSILIIIHLFIDYIILLNYLNSTKFHIIITITNYFLMCTTIFCIICISSIYVLHKNKSWIYIKHNNNEHMPIIAKKMLSLSEAAQHTHSTTDTANAMLNALQNPVLFDQFMAHLMKEFSVEIMLSFIEMNQFQQSVYEFAELVNEFELNENLLPIDVDWRMHFDFIIYPSSVPNSSIVHDELETAEIALCYHLGLKNNSTESSSDSSCDEYDNNNNNNIYLNGPVRVRGISVSTNTAALTCGYNPRKNSTRHKSDYHKEIEIKKIEFLIRAHKLYVKYISLESKLKINLTFKERKKFMKQMGKFNKWVNVKDNDGKRLKMLFKLFETPMERMFILLNLSFVRFKKQYSLSNFSSRSPIAF
eukprot:334191_1